MLILRLIAKEFILENKDSNFKDGFPLAYSYEMESKALSA